MNRPRKIAFAFGGQGSELARVGSTWLGDEIFAEASRTSGVDVAIAVARLTSDLERTSVLQVALVAISLAAWRRLSARGVRPALVCGHSVGEVAAWVASGAIDVRDAIAFAHARGVAMETAARASPGAMLAVTADVDASAIAIAGVEIAARNGPKQLVLTGPHDALEAVRAKHGGRRLDVSGAWHSRAMHAAAPDTLAALARVTKRRAEIPLVTCLDGHVLAPDETPDFVAQLTSPVDWTAVAETLEREHVTDVVCVAPGRVNRGLFRDVFGARIGLHLADDDSDIERIAARLAS